MLSFLQAIIGDMVSLVVIVAVLAGIIKIFQIASTMNEIKDLLVDIKRNTNDFSGASRTQRPAVQEQSMDDVPNPAYAPAALEHEL